MRMSKAHASAGNLLNPRYRPRCHAAPRCREGAKPCPDRISSDTFALTPEDTHATLAAWRSIS